MSGQEKQEETGQPLLDTALHQAQFLLQEYIHQHQVMQYWQAKNTVKQVIKWKKELVTK